MWGAMKWILGRFRQGKHGLTSSFRSQLNWLKSPRCEIVGLVKGL